MSLAQRILDDNERIFMNPQHFGEEHMWNGHKILCVPDEEAALKRKNNSAIDVEWDNHTTEVLIYTPEAGFPEPVRLYMQVLFDGKLRKVLQVNRDGGMYAILLVSQDAKGMEL